MREEVFNMRMNRKRREIRKHARISARMAMVESIRAEGERMKAERGDTSEMRESQAKPAGTSLELGKLLHVNQEVWS